MRRVSARRTTESGASPTFGLDQPKRFTGPDGPQAFVDAFRFDCMPASEALASATPVSPCATYPNENLVSPIRVQ